MTDTQQPASNGKKPTHIAYHVRDAGNDKSFWNRLGVAWAHADGQGFNIQLDTFPLDGRISLRVATEKRTDPTRGGLRPAATHSRKEIVMELRFHHIDQRRNGTADSSAALYHAVFFRDLSEGNMLGIVFEAPGHVAILHLDKLGFNPIGNGPNTWRNNKYEAALRRAIRKHQQTQENQP